MKEQKSLESELQQHTDQIMILEAKVELYEEKMETFRIDIQEKKEEKNRLFEKRDDLIEKKRDLQKDKFEIELESQKDLISVEIQELSEKIGKVIEKSKALTVQMQIMHEESQTDYKDMISTKDRLNLLQRESNQTILNYKKKIADIDNELGNLRNNMREIQIKLNRSNDDDELTD